MQRDLLSSLFEDLDQLLVRPPDFSLRDLLSSLFEDLDQLLGRPPDFSLRDLLSTLFEDLDQLLGRPPISPSHAFESDVGQTPIRQHPKPLDLGGNICVIESDREKKEHEHIVHSKFPFDVNYLTMPP